MYTQLPAFAAAIKQLGQDDVERAAVLGVKPRTIQRYRAGEIPSIVRSIVQHRRLLIGLLLDAEDYPGQELGCPPECPDNCDTHGHPYNGGRNTQSRNN